MTQKSATEILRIHTQNIATLKNGLVHLSTKMASMQAEIDSVTALHSDLSLFGGNDSGDTDKKIKKLASDFHDMEQELRSISQTSKHELQHLSGMMERIATIVSPDTQQLIFTLDNQVKVLTGAYDKMQETLDKYTTNFHDQSTANLLAEQARSNLAAEIAVLKGRLDENDAKTAELFTYRTTIRHIGSTLIGLAAVGGTIWAIYSSMATS